VDQTKRFNVLVLDFIVFHLLRYSFYVLFLLISQSFDDSINEKRRHH